MTDSSEPASASERIDRRLRYQHARWFVQQPQATSLEFRLYRYLRRAIVRIVELIDFVLEPILIPIFKLVFAVSVRVIAAVGPWVRNLFCFFWRSLPDFAKPAKDTTQAGEVLGVITLFAIILSVLQFAIHGEANGCVDVALTGLSCWLSGGLLCLFVFSPGVALAMPRLRSKHECSQKTVFIRSIQRKRNVHVWCGNLVFVLLASLSSVLAALDLIQLQYGLVAATVSAVALSVTVYASLRCCLRLMRYHASRELHIAGFLIIGGALLVGLVAIRLAEKHAILSYMGPLGWVFSQLIRLGEGNWFSILPLALYGVVVGSFGWWVACDARTWNNRRRLMRGRYVTVQEKSKRKSRKYDSDGIRRHLRAQLDCYRSSSWRYWLVGNSGNYYHPRFLAMVFVPIFTYQTALLGLSYWLQGPAPDESNELLLPVLFGPVAGLVALEGVSMLFRSGKLARRPTAVIDSWWKTQVLGLRRIPLQLLLLAPALALASLAVKLHYGYWPADSASQMATNVPYQISYSLIVHSVVQTLIVLVLIRTIAVCVKWITAHEPLVPKLLVAVSPLVGPVVFLAVFFGAAWLLSHPHPGYSVAANFAVLPLLFFVAWLRDG